MSLATGAAGTLLEVGHGQLSGPSNGAVGRGVILVSDRRRRLRPQREPSFQTVLEGPRLAGPQVVDVQDDLTAGDTELGDLLLGDHLGEVAGIDVEAGGNPQ